MIFTMLLYLGQLWSGRCFNDSATRLCMWIKLFTSQQQKGLVCSDINLIYLTATPALQHRNCLKTASTRWQHMTEQLLKLDPGWNAIMSNVNYFVSFKVKTLVDYSHMFNVVTNIAMIFFCLFHRNIRQCRSNISLTNNYTNILEWWLYRTLYNVWYQKWVNHSLISIVKLKWNLNYECHYWCRWDLLQLWALSGILS